MSFSVSVRDVKPLDVALKTNQPIPLPQECRHNAAVFEQLLLKYGPRVLPSFSNLSSQDTRTIAESVAYLVRPDLIKSGLILLGPNPVDPLTKPLYGEDGELVHLANDPSSLSPEFRLLSGSPLCPQGAEFFRCYAGTFNSAKRILGTLGFGSGDCYKPSWPRADMAAYLLDPRDLSDYRYGSGEVRKFHDTLDRQWREA